MKIAILSVSKKGNILAESLKNKLTNESTIIKVKHFHKNIKNIIEEAFNDYNAIIAIMASGIIIRLSAPLIVSKSKDPAIINIDENGKFVVSMLSGHLGGANKLAKKIAKILNATPVITTSTDVNNLLGIDTLAKDLYFKIDNINQILPINKAILEGEKLIFKINKNSDFNFLYDYLKDNTVEINLSFEFDDNVDVNQIDVKFKDIKLNLKKQKIVAGIGCKKDKNSHEILNGLTKACQDIGIPINRVDLLSSASIKKDEKGLHDLANELNIPINFVDINLIKKFDFENISNSEFVNSKFGIKGVCEPSALITAGNSSKLIYKKTAFNGITIAIAVK